ncbi:3',5'-cyclic adenosine monophosphate phosphodiesterase CpdA [Poriferisphaera corsica]|uniref:3',5'-cyclic adenosine monophosphate phosphodiesterase CpdA n=1 Tax=Poriferisphaera corsica TaxID=2528020 RepID=A0A517YT92_9BACT|nr:metallophosphoesterase [Poriferisphaera corsica]QDU33455.1 3',5'-cyclic adenosine monophosphate phosphodiesterase CpdA [Poriferisphaera corsica]
MRIALIGDIHLYNLQLRPRQWFSRRVMGHTNLLLNRRFRFNHGLLHPLMDKIREIKPEMVLCSGDVTTTSLESEFSDIAKFLKPLSKEIPTVVVPGNHDRYTFRAQRKLRMEKILEGIMPDTFPYYRRLTDRWHLIGLDSAIPQILMSRGALKKKQFSAFEMQLGQLSKEDALVLLCHYPASSPPGIPNSWAHNLAEAHQLRKMLNDCPARVLYMHGHIHQPWYWQASHKGVAANTDCTGELAFLNAGSPCMTSSKYPSGQGFWEVELPQDPSKQIGLMHHVPVAKRVIGSKRPKNQDHLTVIDGITWNSRTVL